MTSGTQENVFYMKDGSSRLLCKNMKLFIYLFIFCVWYIFKFDHNKSRDMVQKGWKCIFDFKSSSLQTLME